MGGAPNRTFDRETAGVSTSGLTLLDLGGLVLSAAISAVHMRAHTETDLVRALGPLFWITFSGVAFTSAGPFLFAARKYVRPTPGFPGRGDVYWLVLGAPWVLTAPICLSAAGREGLRLLAYAPLLSVALGCACVYVLVSHWVRWVRPPREATSPPNETAWTDRAGMVLSVTWPLQCAFALIVMSPRPIT